MAMNQRYLSIEKGHMLVIGNTLIMYQSNAEFGGPFTTINTGLQVPGYPAGTTLNWQENSSMAMLSVPSGATVLHAELSWTSLLTSGIFDYSSFKNDPIAFITPAVSTTVTPQYGETTNDIYTRSADVTALVQAGGSGAYTVEMIAGLSGMESTAVPIGNAAGWYLSIVLGVPDESNKFFQINVGNAFASAEPVIDFFISGFSTPATGSVTGRLFAGVQRGDPTDDLITIFTGPDTANLNYQLTRPPMPVNNMIAGFISNTETNEKIDNGGTFGGNHNIPGNTPVAQPFARWYIDIAAFDISPSLGNSQSTLVTRSTSITPSTTVDYNIYNLQIEAEAPDVTAAKAVDKAYADVGDLLHYSVTVTNSGLLAADTVIVSDGLPSGAVFVQGTVLVNNVPMPAEDVTVGVNVGSLAGNGGTSTIEFMAQVTEIPVPNPLINRANVNYTFQPAAGAAPMNGAVVSNEVSTLVQNADLITQGNFVKSVSPANVTIGDIITYTLIFTNMGNTAANNVILKDPIPAGTTYVTGSVTASAPFSGSPATCITLNAPVLPGDTVGVTYQVQVDNIVPVVNPISNTAAITYTYTVDPANPNDVMICGNSNTVTTMAYSAALSIVNSADKAIAYIGDVITYQAAVTNTGNVSTDKVILTDPISNGTVYVVGSLAASVAFTGSPMTDIHLTNSIAPGETVSFTYQVQVTAIPNPNPISNTVNAVFTYTVNPFMRVGVAGFSTSNTVNTVVFKNNYSQEISDLIHSIALQEAAISGIANAEGAKIQRMLALGATPSELICVNKSVSDMLEAISTLESVLKQKLSAVDCQINPICM